LGFAAIFPHKESKMPQFFTAAHDGARLAYRDEGEGMPLLCLAGLTRTMGDFDYLRPHLPPLRLICMDYRGRGASDHIGPYNLATEAQDALALLDHLGVARAAILGTSRGGLIGMVLASIAKNRLLGLCLNDIGPVIERAGLQRILQYLGKNPSAKTHEEQAQTLQKQMQGFDNVPPQRWLNEARLHYRQTPKGLHITYDPALRIGFEAALNAPPSDVWPLFDACAGLPLGLIRGENSDVLSPQTVSQMQARRPDMLLATVPGRGHIPFLDEPESLDLIGRFLAKIG
jgi:pimeloyl-ACP methyl ester carboxylesterase